MAAIRGQQCQSDDVFVSVRKCDKPLIAAAPDLYEALAALLDDPLDMHANARAAALLAKIEAEAGQ